MMSYYKENNDFPVEKEDFDNLYGLCLGSGYFCYLRGFRPIQTYLVPHEGVTVSTGPTTEWRGLQRKICLMEVLAIGLASLVSSTYPESGMVGFSTCMSY